MTMNFSKDQDDNYMPDPDVGAAVVFVSSKKKKKIQYVWVNN